MLTVGDIMSKRVVTVELDDTLEEAQTLMHGGHFHHLPVVEDGKLIGIVSERDVLRERSPKAGKLSERPEDAATLHKPVHVLMSRKLVTTTVDTPLVDAAEMVLANHVSCLPVVAANGEVVGVVTTTDLLRHLIEELRLGRL